MHRVLGMVFFIAFFSSPFFTLAIAQELPATEPLSAEMIEKRLEGDFGVDEIAATSGWVQSIGIVDWLGPLAPVALSPFFGVTCLSGLAIGALTGSPTMHYLALQARFRIRRFLQSFLASRC